MHYSELDVWQRSMDFALFVYNWTAAFPGDERFGLTAQMRRAALSIPSNVAEAEGRWHWRDRARFYLNARGSLYEVETQALLGQRLGYPVDVTSLLERSAKIGQLINGEIRKLRQHATE